MSTVVAIAISTRLLSEASISLCGLLHSRHAQVNCQRDCSSFWRLSVVVQGSM
jgi:hypothetical protein